METQVSSPPITRIGRYTIASSDMYYSEMGQRDVCVCDDPEKGLRVWGEMPMADQSLQSISARFSWNLLFLQYGKRW